MYIYVCVRTRKYFEAYKLCHGLHAISDSCHKASFGRSITIAFQKQKYHFGNDVKMYF